MLRPKCMPYTYIDGEQVWHTKLWAKTTTFNGLTYTAEGYFLPCCFCDHPSVWPDMVKHGFYDESLHIDNNETVDDIITSDTWRKWVDLIQHRPEDAPPICHKKCKLQDDH